MTLPAHGTLDHLELWVPDLDRAVASIGRLPETLGHTLVQRWDHGRSRRLGPTCVVVEESRAPPAPAAPGTTPPTWRTSTASRSDPWRSRHPTQSGTAATTCDAARLAHEAPWPARVCAKLPGRQGCARVIVLA